MPAAFLAPLVALGAFFATAVGLHQAVAAESILRIALFSAVMTIGAALAASFVERVRHRANSWAGVAPGIHLGGTNVILLAAVTQDVGFS